MYVLAAILASALVTAVPAAAQGEMWCYRYSKTSAVACVFPSFDHCLRSAAIMGGVCERAADVKTDPQTARTRRPAKAKR